MERNKQPHQNIDCTVCSCAYNHDGKHCTLDCISVEPCKKCHSGKAEDESWCGSYKCK